LTRLSGLPPGSSAPTLFWSMLCQRWKLALGYRVRRWRLDEHDHRQIGFIGQVRCRSRRLSS
jgi:hypothetical protein